MSKTYESFERLEAAVRLCGDYAILVTPERSGLVSETHEFKIIEKELKAVKEGWQGYRTHLYNLNEIIKGVHLDA